MEAEKIMSNLNRIDVNWRLTYFYSFTLKKKTIRRNFSDVKMYTFCSKENYGIDNLNNVCHNLCCFLLFSTEQSQANVRTYNSMYERLWLKNTIWLEYSTSLFVNV